LNVTVSRELTLSTIDHLYVLVTEEMNLDLPVRLRTRIEKAITDSGFEGRGDESITVPAGTPRKIPPVGPGKAEKTPQRGPPAPHTAVRCQRVGGPGAPVPLPGASPATLATSWAPASRSSL